MARELVEITQNLIISHIKSDIASALADVRSQRADAKVTTEVPQSYFIYQGAAAYRTPAIFAIVDSVDFRVDAKAANHINASVKINISAVVEDRNMDQLTIKSFRYQAALHQVLTQQDLTSADLAVTLRIKVVNASFSPIYTISGEQGNPQGVFRKEVVLECEVEHYENF